MEKNRLEAFSDGVLGGFCPVEAFAAVTLVSGWWIFAVRKKKKDVSGTPKEE